MSGRLFTVRLRDGAPGSLVCLVDSPNLVLTEICATCNAQGVINPLHDDGTPHAGSPYFKPWRCTPEYLRKWANDLEAEGE